MAAHGTTYSTVINANNCWTFASFMATRITQDIVQRSLEGMLIQVGENHAKL
jgi:hypothetical protein